MKIEHAPLWLERFADTIKREIAEPLKQITDTIIRRQTTFVVCLLVFIVFLLVLIAISNHDSASPDGSEREPATSTTPASEASAPTDRALLTPKAEPAPKERPEIGTPVPDAKVNQAARNGNSGVFVRIDFRGSNAILNTVRTHAALYRRFGAEKLPVRKHSVAKRGDNFCTALADEIDKLFLSCPEVTSELWSSLGNQGSSRAITEGQLFSIPNIQVVRYEYRNVVKEAPAEAEATYGKLIHNSMALPVPDSTLLTLTGFAIRIYVSDIALALEVKSAVEALDLANTFPQIERSAANTRKPDLFSDQYAAPMDIEKECKPKDAVIVKEAALIEKEAAFWKSLDWLRDWQPPACALHCRSDNECVTINLIDQAVAPHWDLGIHKEEEENLTFRKVKVRIFEPQIPTADVPLPSPERCNVIEFKDEHHGTHIASILASRANGRSFIGLGSASKLRTYSLQDVNSDEIADIVSARLESLEGPQIFVFASSFNTGEEDPTKRCSLKPSYISKHLDSCDPPRLKTTRDGPDLRKQNFTVHTIDGTKAFWIVAAGQRESADSGYEIDSRFGVAPMNLGDFPNVLVVSACENCGVETEPNLWRKANYSSEGDYPDQDTRPERFRPWYVHVGAPGRDLFGAVDQYAQATAPGGTSEAAGFAGSVAAAMVNCYPGHFFMKQKNHIHYGLLKERLQLTSTPFPGGEENLSRISAGILDPAVALLDPTKHWVRLNDQRGWDGTDNPYYELEDLKWCAETISVSKIDDQRKRPLSTKNSYRIYRLPKTGGDEKAQWILYRAVKSDNLDYSSSQIRSLGPYYIDRPEPSEPLLTGDLISLKGTTRRTLKVEEIADLVLAGRITTRETTCNP